MCGKFTHNYPGPFSGVSGRVVETNNTKVKLELASLGMRITLKKQAAELTFKFNEKNSFAQLGQMQRSQKKPNILIMLGELITSKTRLRLLIKFFISQANRGYLNGLATEMGESTNAIRKAESPSRDD